MTDYAPVDLELGDQVEFELNGRRVHAPPGTMLVDAAFANGVEIPIFCYEPRLGPALGACRMCLVEVEGMRGLQTACSTPVSQDMVVHTKSELAVDGQDGVLELILANHPLDCPVCDKGGECPLQDRTFLYGPGETRFLERKRHFPKPLDLSSLIALDRERCISCFRCVRFSQEVAEDGQLTFQERGGDSEITTFTGNDYEGRFTGNVVDICPVGALTSIPYRFVARPWDVTNTESVCGTCAVGCNVELTTREGRVQRVSGREHPNWRHEEGWLSDKCRYAFAAAWSPDRLTSPLIRDGGTTREVSIEEAVAAAAVLLGREEARPGIVVGPTATVEEGYLAQEIAAATDGSIQQLGIPAEPLAPVRALEPADLGDLDNAPLIVLVGGDPANQQSVVELRIRKALRHGSRLIVLGARPHALTGLGRFEQTAPGGLADALRRNADEIRECGAPIIVWDEHDCSQEPTAIAAVSEILRDLPDGKQLELGAHVNGAGLRALGIPADGVLEAAEAGDVGTLVCLLADPTSAPGAGRWDVALPKTGPIVAIATHASELTDAANVVIPASMGTEHEGTHVSMNGIAQRLRPGQEPPEGAAPGWQILGAIAHRLGMDGLPRTPATVVRAAAAARPGLSGVSYREMGRLGARLPRPPSATVNGAHASREPAGEGLRLVTTRRIFGDASAMRSDALAHVRQPADVTLAPADATRLGLSDGVRARLASDQGDCVLPVRVDEAAQEGVAFAAIGVPGAGVERLLPADHGPVRVHLSPA